MGYFIVIPDLILPQCVTQARGKAAIYAISIDCRSRDKSDKFILF